VTDFGRTVGAFERRLWEDSVLGLEGPWHVDRFEVRVEQTVDRDRLTRALLHSAAAVERFELHRTELRRVAGRPPAADAVLVPPVELDQARFDPGAGPLVRASWTPAGLDVRLHALGGDRFDLLGALRAPQPAASTHPRRASRAGPDARSLTSQDLLEASTTRLEALLTPALGSGHGDPDHQGREHRDGRREHLWCDQHDEAEVVAAWAVVLSRVLRTDNVLIGVASGALRVQLDPRTGWPELCRQVDGQLEAGRRHPMDLAAVAERAGLRHVPSVHTRLRLPTAATADGLCLNGSAAGVPGALLVVTPEQVRYDRSRVDDTMLDALVAAVDQVLAGADHQPLEWIQLVSAQQRQQALARAGSVPAVSDRRMLHELVDGADDVDAVVCGDQRISYRELSERSGALARRLRDRGVVPGDLVGVLLPRSVDLVVTFLAVLATGAAYCPIDPDHPVERITAMVADGNIRVLVADPRAPAVPGVERIEPRLPPTGSGRDASLTARDEGDRLAYVIFTSGSTGRPKGVEVTHRSIVATTLARYQVFPGPYRCYLTMAGPSFDALGAGLYLTLSAGGTVVLPTADEVRDPWLLAERMQGEQVSHFDAVPAQYAGLLQAAPQVAAALRCVVVGGEECPAELVGLHRELARSTVMINEYGPTEAAVWALWYRCWPGPPLSGRVPIGRPIAGAQAHVRDLMLNPMPFGLPGELCLGGVGLAAGYRGRTELTAERFPLDPHGGGRLYRTGDLVRWSADGQLEFLGRIDDQVKIRGVRVELGEVETALSAHPEVIEAIATTQRTGHHARLVAHVTVSSPGVVGPEELVRWSAQRLPAAMVPSRVQILERMPRTPNGKADRRALGRGGDLIVRRRSPPDEGDHGVLAAVRDALQDPGISWESKIPNWVNRLWAPALVSLSLPPTMPRLMPASMEGRTVRELADLLRPPRSPPTAARQLS
jgi:amino acid adenylation domain-containing protein